jgi:hypothetical protein
VPRQDELVRIHGPARLLLAVESLQLVEHFECGKFNLSHGRYVSPVI